MKQDHAPPPFDGANNAKKKPPLLRLLRRLPPLHQKARRLSIAHKPLRWWLSSLTGCMLLLSLNTLAAPPTSRPLPTSKHTTATRSAHTRRQPRHNKSTDKRKTDNTRHCHHDLAQLARCLAQEHDPVQHISLIQAAARKGPKGRQILITLTPHLWHLRRDVREATRKAILQLCGRDFLPIFGFFRNISRNGGPHKDPLYQKVMDPNSPLSRHRCMIPTMIGALRDMSTLARYEALKVLRIQGKAAQHAVLRAMHHPLLDVRIDALWTLRKWKALRLPALPTLKQKLHSPNKDIARLSLEGLMHLDKQAKGAIQAVLRARLLQHPSSIVRYRALSFLCQQKAPYHLYRSDFLKLLHGPPGALQRRAQRCLKKHPLPPTSPHHPPPTKR